MHSIAAALEQLHCWLQDVEALLAAIDLTMVNDFISHLLPIAVTSSPGRLRQRQTLLITEASSMTLVPMKRPTQPLMQCRHMVPIPQGPRPLLLPCPHTVLGQSGMSHRQGMPSLPDATSLPAALQLPLMSCGSGAVPNQGRAFALAPAMPIGMPWAMLTDLRLCSFSSSPIGLLSCVPSLRTLTATSPDVAGHSGMQLSEFGQDALPLCMPISAPLRDLVPMVCAEASPEGLGLLPAAPALAPPERPLLLK